MEPKPAEKTESPEPRRPEPERKPYVTPRLTAHGKIAQATLQDLSTPSDRSLKEGFAPVDSRAVLAAVAALPIERWSYKGETVRHLGPMAQDFAAAFGLGADDRHIFPSTPPASPSRPSRASTAWCRPRAAGSRPSNTN